MKVNKNFTAVVLFVFVLSVCRQTQASVLDNGLKTIDRQFTQDVSDKFPTTTAVTVAVFPFQADKSLAKKRVDVAVAELLSQKLIRNNKFKLLERSQLESILREQKLGLSGAVESETAAKVGKLAGARFVVLGTVIRTGKSYQISAKLVDSDTSEIISGSIVEVPVGVFDEEAARYLVLVPDTQTIGLYLIYAKLAPFNVKIISTMGTISSYIKQDINTPEDSAYIGGGVRYYPFSQWLFDLSYITQRKSDPDPNSSSFYYSTPLNGTVAITKLMFDRQFRLSSHFNTYLGGGLMHFSLPDMPALENQTKITPTAGLGVEWRPQSRFGLMISSNYVFLQNNGQNKIQEFKCTSFTNGKCNTTVLLGEKVWELSLPKYTAEANLSFYF